MPTFPSYASNLLDKEWEILEPWIPRAKPGGRPPKHTRRRLLDAMFYLNRTGCQWRMLPNDFPPKSTVFEYYSAWRKSELWAKLNELLRDKVRLAEGRKRAPTAGVLDSQSVKGAEQGGATIGYDAGKKISGRKRHLLVDTLGLILGLCVTSAAVQDRDGAKTLLGRIYFLFGRLQIIWADAGYVGELVQWVKNLRPCEQAASGDCASQRPSPGL